MSLTVNQAQNWINTSFVGDVIEYYRGDLAYDKVTSDQLKYVAMEFWSAYENDKVTLYQKRHGDRDYSYYAQRKIGSSNKGGGGR